MGTLTTKTIDEREYYYLQWREGEKVKSQYVAPVSPSSVGFSPETVVWQNTRNTGDSS